MTWSYFNSKKCCSNCNKRSCSHCKSKTCNHCNNLSRNQYNNSPVNGVMPGAFPSYDNSPYYSGSSNSYPNNALAPYYPQQSSLSLVSSNSNATYNSDHAQQLAQRTQIGGNDVTLYLNGKEIKLSQASISSFCTDYVCRILARSNSLSCHLLDKLNNDQRISIRHRETMSGNVVKQKFSTDIPNVSLSAGLLTALGDVSQLRDIIHDFFSYTYTDAIRHNETYSTHYYANDQYTITGCFLQRKVFKQSNGVKMPLVSGKFTDTTYETACYLFTFKVDKAARFLEKYLNGSR